MEKSQQLVWHKTPCFRTPNRPANGNPNNWAWGLAPKPGGPRTHLCSPSSSASGLRITSWSCLPLMRSSGPRTCFLEFGFGAVLKFGFGGGGGAYRFTDPSNSTLQTPKKHTHTHTHTHTYLEWLHSQTRQQETLGFPWHQQQRKQTATFGDPTSQKQRGQQRVRFHGTRGGVFVGHRPPWSPVAPRRVFIVRDPGRHAHTQTHTSISNKH